MTVLAIDQGTSATKAVVVDGDGAVLALAEASLHVDGDTRRAPSSSTRRSCGPAWSPPGPQALAAAGQPGARGASDWPTRARRCWRGIARRALHMGAAIVWQDRRAEVICERLADHSDVPRRSITGLELDPYFVAPKIAWLREQIGDGPTITTTDTWMLHRLCGAFATDVATAGRSLLLDLDTGAVERRAPASCSASIRPPCPRVVGNAEAARRLLDVRRRRCP